MSSISCWDPWDGPPPAALVQSRRARRIGWKPGTLSIDNFTDANATNLTAHTPDFGPAWTVGTGAYQIQGNRAQPNNGAGTSLGVVLVAYSAVVAKCTINRASTTALGGILLRFQDASNYWFAAVKSGGTNNFSIIRRLGGTDTVEAQATVTLNTGTDYTLQFGVDPAGNFTAIFNGATTLTFSDAGDLPTNKKHGIGDRGDASAQFDNWVLQT